MEKEKQIEIIDKLISQGFEKGKIIRYVEACKKNYETDLEIYDKLSDLLLDEKENTNDLIKKLAFDSFDHSITIAEGMYVDPITN